MKSTPLTQTQLGMFLEWNADRASEQYNICIDNRFPSGTVDAARLADAVRLALNAYPVFRTRFAERDGEIVQFADEALALAVGTRTAREDDMPRVRADFRRPFDPFTGPMVRAEVVTTEAATHLLLDLFHLIFDGSSWRVFSEAIAAAYEGRELPREEMTLADYAAFEPTLLGQEAYRAAKEDHAARFAGKAMTVPEDGEKVEKVGGGGQRKVEIPLSTSTSTFNLQPSTFLVRATARVPRAEVEAFCRAHAVHPNLFFMGAFARTLALYANTTEAVFFTVNHGRRDPRLKSAVGAFVKSVPVLAELRGEKTLDENLKGLKLHRAGDYPFTHFCRDLGMKPGFGYVFQDGTTDLTLRLDGIVAEMTTFSAVGVGRLPTLQVGGDAQAYELDLSLLAGAYSKAWCAQFVNRVAEVARQFLAHPDALLGEIPTVSDAEAAELVALARGKDLSYDTEATVVDLFRRHVRENPSAIAVVAANGTFTYGELDERSDALAAFFVEKGVKPGDFVALKLGRVREFPLAAIAAWKAGAAYVPVDPEYPADRIAYMLEDSGARIVIDEAELERIGGEKRWRWTKDDRGGEKRWRWTKEGNFSQSNNPTIQQSNNSTVHLHLDSPPSPAYMIYTSGSTGKPKGVVVPHRALRHLIEWTRRDRAITYKSRVVQHASFSFDASVIDIFPVLASGGELHLFAEEIRKDLPAMRDYIVKNGITCGTFSTQIGMALVDAYPDLPLRNVMFGGEKLLPTAKTDMTLMNGYGPTEFCVCSSYQTVDQDETGDIPIGRAVAGTWSFVVDRYGHLLPQGLAGEIALAGPQIADGYWHQSEKTAKVFVNGRYHTGDLARYDAKGRLLYLGRMDFQVKLRGFRIEIGEIEHAASTFPGIGKVAAEVRDVGGTKHLVLYYEEGQRSEVKGQDEGQRSEVKGQTKDDKFHCPPPPFFSTSDLKDFLSKSLTAYMVPDYFVRVDEMPMTPNGKINRKVLPAPSAEAETHEYVAPRDGAEKTIAEAWGALLKIERYGATDDFFASGGTSLLGIKAVVALQKAGLDVQYGDLFKHKTPRALAAFLSGGGESSDVGLQTSNFKLQTSNYDFGAIDALLAKTRTDLFADFHVHSLGDVLLTGATGYLGIHVLRYLLEHTSSSVTVLLRAKGKASPERRLDAQYVYYFGERLPRRFHDRVSYLEGDITDTRLFSPANSQSNNPTIQQSNNLPTLSTVLNCAALVKHYIADDALDRVNVKGVENLLAWCEATGARFVQMSTYSVGGLVDAVSPARLDERRLFVGQDSDNDYVRTKFLAERAVLAAVAAGKVRAKIMRLGNLMGREADGEFQMNVGANAFVNSLRSYKSIGAYPLDELAAPLEMSPIDRVAEAVCLLATTPDDMVVFHPYNCYALDMGAVLGALNRRGYAVDFASRAEFAARVEALKADPSRADELQGVLHYAQRHLDGRKVTPVANAWTTTVLYRLGFRWKPADDRYLANFFDMLDGLAVFG